MNINQKLAVARATRRTEAYVGITKLESSRIFDLDPTHAVAYLKLRWLANFRTGWIGNESARVNPSVEKLLDAVSMSESEFKDLMNALIKAGLVAELSIDDQEIVLNLPLSVKGFEKVSKSTQRDLTNPISTDSTEVLGTDSKQYTSTFLSVLNAPFENNPLTENKSSPEKSQAAKKTYEEDSECGSWELVVEVETKVDELDQLDNVKNLEANPQASAHHPQSVQGVSIPNFGHFIESEFENAMPPVVAPMLIGGTSLEMRLEKEGFRYTSTKISRVIFKRIEGLYNEKEISDSIACVLADPRLIPTAVALEKHLAESKSRQRQNRGRVAL